jgi:hypothetical protein
MKRCSTCNRTYTEPNLSFCIDDGTPLTPVQDEDDATVVRPRDDGEDRNAGAYQPPSSFVRPGAEPKSRRLWPWIVGVAGAFILGILMIGLAVAFLAPRVRRQIAQANSNVNRSENSNTATEESNANTQVTENVDAPVPTDHAAVLAQLTAIENEWTVANLNADRKKLDRILADDFVGQEEQGELQSKADYLRDIERNTNVEKWEFGDLKLALAGDRATLSGTITYFAGDRQAAFNFTDKFVWRDGRWQATGAEISSRENPGGVDL